MPASYRRPAELVLVLVLGGALWAALAEGGVLIDTARLWVLERKMDAAEMGLRNYQETYLALPGDDPGAADRFGRSPARLRIDRHLVDTTGDGRIDGVAFDHRNPEAETFAAWRDLRFAGLIDGEPELTGLSALPATPYGLMALGRDTLGFPLGLCVSRVPAGAAAALDDREDDGRPATGTLRAVPQSGAPSVPAAAPDVSATYGATGDYIVCRRLTPQGS